MTSHLCQHSLNTYLSKQIIKPCLLQYSLSHTSVGISLCNSSVNIPLDQSSVSTSLCHSSINIPLGQSSSYLWTRFRKSLHHTSVSSILLRPSSVNIPSRPYDCQHSLMSQLRKHSRTSYLWKRPCASGFYQDSLASYCYPHFLTSQTRKHFRTSYSCQHSLTSNLWKIFLRTLEDQNNEVCSFA